MLFCSSILIVNIILLINMDINLVLLINIDF